MLTLKCRRSSARQNAPLKGNPHTGGELADRLGISRQYVSMLIKGSSSLYRPATGTGKTARLFD